jgi:hypothetical protein
LFLQEQLKDIGTVEFHGFNAFEEPAYGPGASNDGGSANMYRQAQSKRIGTAAP